MQTTEQSRYLIGIDLGTTNSAVAYVDCCVEKNPSLSTRSFDIPQLHGEGLVDTSTVLPSFCYRTREGEFNPSALALPWKGPHDLFVGHFARERGAQVPTQLVQSAKSWLCNSAAQRRDPILPVSARDPQDRMSPVEATAAYLSHIREAWNSRIAKGNPEKEMEEQEIVLTVPASFDEVARTLTVEAAKQAGFRHLTLLEEPQAAFYCWIQEQGNRWKELLPVGSTILVCDIGGGTSDFSLIEVCDKEGEQSFQRTAVGRHLLLGGDNIDAAIAHQLEKKQSSELNTQQWLSLQAHARSAKEALLDAPAENHYRAAIQGKGASIVAGSHSIEVGADELQSLIMSGFFPLKSWEEARLLSQTRGIRSMGLPYEDDPAITKQLAHFLHQQAHGKNPQYVLFNGGTMKAQCFQQAVLDALALWSGGERPQLLKNKSLDLAVSRGASYYGKVRRGMGVKIRSGSPRSYYLGVEVKQANGSSQEEALVILSKGREEGYSHEVEQIFSLTANQAVSFRLYSSQVRLQDLEGERIPLSEEELSPLPLIQTVLRYGKPGTSPQIPVRLRVKMTELGTLELWLKACQSAHEWKLEYQLRRSSGQEDSIGQLTSTRKEETFDKESLEKVQKLLQQRFTEKGYKPALIVKELEDALSMPKLEWPPSILRALADTLLTLAPQRLVSKAHEARWWNLIGFFLRPGLGYPLDDHRIKAIWKVILEDGSQVKDPDVKRQRWICLRRIASGLRKGQEIQLASQLSPELLEKKSDRIRKQKGSNPQDYAEQLRALASFEHIPLALKKRLGNALVEKIHNQRAEKCDFWALARIGARQLVYGSPSDVIPKELCAEWIDQLLASYDRYPKDLSFVLTQLARKTEQREINLPSQLTDTIYERCQSSCNQKRLKRLLYHAEKLNQQEQEAVLGDLLPTGLSIEMGGSS